MFSEIINPFINVRNQIKNSAGVWVDKKNPEVTQHSIYYTNIDLSNGSLIIFNEPNKEITIESLEISSVENSSVIFPRLHTDVTRDGRLDGNLFVGMSGSALWDMTFKYLNDSPHPLMEILRYDTEYTPSRFKMGNKRPIHLPKGGKLGIYTADNYDPEIHTFNVNIFYTLKELL